MVGACPAISGVVDHGDRALRTNGRSDAMIRIIEKAGPAPNANAAGAVQTMSDALAELSRIIATEIQQ